MQVRPEVVNSYRVVVENKYGRSEPSPSLQIPKRAGPPLMACIKPDVHDVKPRSLQLQWQPAENQAGFVDATIKYIVEKR